MLEIAATRPGLSENSKEEYNHQQWLYSAQPEYVRSQLVRQADRIAQALAHHKPQVSYSLPDRIILTLDNSHRSELTTISEDRRTYSAGGFINHLGGRSLYKILLAQLSELEKSPDPAVSLASGLLRHAAAMQIVHNLLPAGGSTTVKEADGVKTNTASPQFNHPSVMPEAGKYFQPQWNALDENGGLLVKTLEEADSCIEAMQGYHEMLSYAADLAPYISADEDYSRKRYGMLRQLVSQGRALAIYHVNDIISVIKERAASGRLNRGLTLGLPYFDDQGLRMDELKMEIIPAGLVMFVPAFVVLAVRREAMALNQDKHLSSSTRKHLLDLLERIAQAFEIS